MEAERNLTDVSDHNRTIVREALTNYLWPKLIIEPKHPTDGMYHAEHEHRKEVWGHKCVKDFIIQ